MNTSIEQIVAAAKLMGKRLGVISTVSPEGRPEAAYVYFTFDDSLNIYFATRAGSRKYKNLMQNPHAAFVMANDNPPQTIQLEGTAAPVTDPHEQRTLFPELLNVLREGGYVPPVTVMMDSELEFMKLTTTWIRLGNFEVKMDGGEFHVVTKE